METSCSSEHLIKSLLLHSCNISSCNIQRRCLLKISGTFLISVNKLSAPPNRKISEIFLKFPKTLEFFVFRNICLSAFVNV